MVYLHWKFKTKKTGTLTVEIGGVVVAEFANEKNETITETWTGIVPAAKELKITFLEAEKIIPVFQTL